MKPKTTFEALHGVNAKFFFCNCGGHALLVERFEDQISVGMWGQTGLRDYPNNIWERIKLVWAFLRGRLFVDDIILNVNEAKLVAEHLRGLINDTGKTVKLSSSKKLASSN